MAPNKGCSLCGESDSWKQSLIECNVSRCVEPRKGRDRGVPETGSIGRLGGNEPSTTRGPDAGGGAPLGDLVHET